MKLSEVAAIVTGGGSGLGRATAEALAAEGARVAVFDLNAAAAEEAAKAIGGLAVALAGLGRPWVVLVPVVPRGKSLPMPARGPAGKEPVLTILLRARLGEAEWDVEGAEVLLRQAITSRPGEVVLLQALAGLLEQQGRTREALELYLQKLSPDGIVALHISNRYLDLEPVLGNLANALHLAGLAQYDDMRNDIPRIPGKRAAHWVLLANRKEDFGKLAQDRRWKTIRSRPGVGIWTDDYSNLLGVFKWN